MNKKSLRVFSILTRNRFIGLVIIFLAGFFLLTRSAEMQSSADSTDRSLVLGRLAYATVTGTFGAPLLGISTANADGTGVSNLTNFPPVTEPAWSPDGTRLVYISLGLADVHVMNADGSNQTNLSNSMGVSETNPVWSVTGKIAYERENQIWTMNADGTNQLQFAAITQPAPTDPAWSADGAKLTFVSGGEIWKINADGTNEMRVTTNASADADPDWSPDGTKIVFTKGAGGISVVDANGTNENNLTTVPSDSKPVWSSDGTTIAFRRSATPSGIYLMDATGGNQVRIIADTPGTTGTTNSDPAWQPVAHVPNTFTISGRITRNDLGFGGVTVNLNGTTNAATTTDATGNYQFSGLQPNSNYVVSPSYLNHHFTPPNRRILNVTGNRIANFTAAGVCVGVNCVQNGKIAFVRGGEIFTMKFDGSDQTNISNNPATESFPNYSPDGSKILFSTTRDGNSEIYQMNADGSNQVRLTTNPAEDTFPYYSPDGASIVFVSNRDGNDEIYKMDAGGTNQIRLTNDALVQKAPAFSPDGQKIIYATTELAGPNKLWTMNIDGTNQQAFPELGFYNRPSYSPDGSKILFVYGFDITTQNIWTANANGSNRVEANFGRSSPSYSPDGTKIVHVCCFSNPSASGIYVSDVGGGFGPRITTNSSDDYPDWQPVVSQSRTPFDFDGDGRADVSVFRPSDGVWYQLRSTLGYTGQQLGVQTDVVVPADYDGDLKTDVAVWRPSDGNFYILNSFDSTLRIENFGLAGDVPTGGDWDGDGKADVAVYRGGTQGVFYYRGTMGNPQGNTTFIPWGLSGDKAVAGDYDGDGITDAAIYRNGVWYVRKSSNGQLFAASFGLANDVVIPADYDADGKTDMAVYRDGVWYLLRSTQGFTAFQYGISDDIPVPADYDGDGRADPAVYRNGIWWILNSQSSTNAVYSFGLASDKPIPAAYVR